MIPYSKPLFSKFFTSLFLFGFLFLLNPDTFGAAGEVDLTFNPNLARNFNDLFLNAVVNKIVVQPDGKILIAGNFRSINGAGRTSIARLNTDGTIDAGFFPPDISDGAAVGGTLTALALLPNGKIVIGGNFTSIGGMAQAKLARLNADGSLDTTFNPTASPGSSFSPNAAIINIHPYLDSSFLVVGDSFAYTPGSGSPTYSSLVKFNNNGAVDQSVRRSVVIGGGTVTASALLPDGKILAAHLQLLRLNPDGIEDSTFTTANFNAPVSTIVPQPDGKILVGGEFSAVNGFLYGRIVRLNSDGTVDGSFNTNIGAVGQTGGGSGYVKAIKLTSSGQIIVAGSFVSFNNVTRNSLARLNSDGNVDQLFAPPSSLAPYNDVEVQSDGKVIGATSSFQNTLRRFNAADGSPDAAFQVLVKFNGIAYRILALPDGKIMVGGTFSFANNVAKILFARFNADGTLDTGFTQAAYTNGNGQGLALAAQPDGKILTGASPGGNATRLNPNGTVDFMFPSTQDTYDIKVLADGRIVIVGNNGLFKIFNAGGTLVSNYTGSVNAAIGEVIVQPDGKYLVAGNFTQALGASRVGIARFNADGSLDAGFNTPGVAGAINEIELQADGKIIIGGTFTAVNFDTNRKYLARLNADGSLDASFAPSLNQAVSALKLETSGRILIGGSFTTVNGVPRARIARLTTTGLLDTSFNAGSGANDTVYDFDLQADGKILVAGQFTRLSNIDRVGIARLLNANAPARAFFDFDGDGKSDISVFRPATGFWYIARPTGVPSQNFDAVQFGANGDLPVPADYDGDGKTDVAVFRPSDGVWYLLQSTDGFRAAQFGASGDIPVPGDFDGDGKANLAVFRPSAGSWYIARATGTPSQNFDSVPFGANGDKPVAGADFDGDGKADVVVFRPSTGDWYRLNSSNGQFVGVHFGTAEDKPVAADYDGDGKTDLAVWRPSDGVWYRINSATDSFAATQFGVSEDRPSPADFDGDGKADLAVFRPSQGIWYLLRSTQGFAGAQFGASGDIPTPNSFVR